MEKLINFYDGYISENTIWFSNLNSNALMTLNIDDGTIDKIGIFPKCKSYQKNLHIRVIEYNGKLYFVPRYGNYVHVYDLENKCFEENIQLPYENSVYIANAVMDSSSFIWIVPAYFCDGIVVLNPQTKSAEQFEKLNDFEMTSGAYIAADCVSFNEGIITFCIFKSNIVFFVDTIKRAVVCEKLTESCKAYSFISYDGVTFYFSNYLDNRIVIWNKTEKTYTFLTEQIIDNSVDYMYWNYIIKNGQMLCLPCDNSDLLLVNLPKHSEKHILINKMVEKNSSNPMFTFFKEDENQIYLFPSGSDGLLIIDSTDWSIRLLNYVLSDELRQQIQSERKDNFENEMCSGVVTEHVEYEETLSTFLDFVVKNRESESPMKKSDYGCEIYKAIKNKIT